MSKRIITSTVITDPKDWADEVFLAPHEPIRHDILEALDVLQEKYFVGTVQWKVDNFFKWYSLFYEQVHHHHHAEETIFFPDIKERVKDDGGIPERFSKDHTTLVKMMEDVKNFKSKFEASKTSDEKKQAGTDLRALWTKFSTDMLQHLAEEERVFVPLIRKHMTKQDHEALIQKMIQSQGFLDGLSNASIGLPWMERSMRKWKGDAGADEFMATLPAPFRLLHYMFWRPAFNRTLGGLLSSLKRDEPPPKETSSWTTMAVGVAVIAGGAFWYLKVQK
jgi:hemerythrin-like domain-containing protein